jgi:hypothetical protein
LRAFPTEESEHEAENEYERSRSDRSFLHARIELVTPKRDVGGERSKHGIVAALGDGHIVASADESPGETEREVGEADLSCDRRVGPFPLPRHP